METRAINPPVVLTGYSTPRVIVSYSLTFYAGFWCIYQEYQGGGIDVDGGFDLYGDYRKESDARQAFDRLTGRT